MSFEGMQDNIRSGNIENIKKLEFDMSDFMVLGLLGPAGSGKDLVADWFVTKGFVKVAFADPMKRFVSRCFGIDWNRLWGPSEKRNEMFDVSGTWWYEAVGHLGTAANEIVNGVLPEGKRVEGYLALHDWFLSLRKTYPDKISTRVILQTMGTEWGRKVEPLMWTNYAFSVVDYIRGGYLYSQPGGLTDNVKHQYNRYTGVIIPDHRFRNEIEVTRKHRGYVLRLNRLAMNKEAPDIGVVNHQSEAEHKELSDKLFDAVYELPEGVDKVHELLEVGYKEKIWARSWDRTSEYECNILRCDDSPVSPS